MTIPNTYLIPGLYIDKKDIAFLRIQFATLTHMHSQEIIDFLMKIFEFRHSPQEQETSLQSIDADCLKGPRKFKHEPVSYYELSEVAPAFVGGLPKLMLPVLEVLGAKIELGKYTNNYRIHYMVFHLSTSRVLEEKKIR